METVCEIYELLGGRQEPRVATLVTPYRRHVETVDAAVREAPFSSSFKIPHRLFVFRDLLLIGRSTISRKTTAQQLLERGPVAAPSASGADTSTAPRKRSSFRLSFAPSLGKRKSANLTAGDRGRFESEASGVTVSPSMVSSTLTASAKLKLVHWLALADCSVKSIPRLDGAAGTDSGLQLTNVTRSIQPALDAERNVVDRTVTKVEKFEVWLATELARDRLLQTLGQLIAECQAQAAAELEERTAAAAAAANGNGSAEGRGRGGQATATGTPAPKLRAWAKNKPRSLRLAGGAAFSNEAERRASDSSVIDTSTTPLSLRDLEERYNVDFAAPLPLDKAHAFSVQFGEGQMGFSLSSGAGVGVIIARLQPGSFADLAGVTVGDRVASVNGVDVDFDTTWRRCVEIVHAAGRPVTLGFVRNDVTSATIAAVESEAPPSPPPRPSGGADAGAGSSTVGAKGGSTVVTFENLSGSGGDAAARPSVRRWARNRDKLGGPDSGLVSLHEVEKMYLATGGGGADLTPLPSLGPSGAAGISAAAGGGEDKDDDDDPDVDDDDADARPVTRSVSAMSLAGPRDARVILTEHGSRASSDEERQCFGLLLEVLATETNYVKDLRALIKDYIVPLRRATRRLKCRERENGPLLCEHGAIGASCTKSSTESGPLLSPDDVKTVFMNAETLMQVHFELLAALTKGIEAADAPDLAEPLCAFVGVFSAAFLHIRPLLTSAYGLYCYQYPAATERLHELRGSYEEVDDFLRRREARSKQTSLRSLLIKPVQRICRYPLLFQELLKKMRRVDRDAMRRFVGEFQTTTSALEGVADDVNRKVDAEDANIKMLAVFHELGGAEGEIRVAESLLAPSRRFVRTDDVFFREAPFDTEALPSKLYMFTDLVIIAQERESGLVGGGALGSRARTKSRARPKSFGNLLLGLGSSKTNFAEADPVGRATASSSTGLGANDRPAWTMKVVHWIDLAGCQARSLAEPDEAGWWGLQLKSVERVTVPVTRDTDTDKRRSASRRSLRRLIGIGGAGTTAGANSEGSGTNTRIVTSIRKFQLWLAEKEPLDAVLAALEECIGMLEIQQMNTEIGKELFGVGPGRTRSWAAKRRGVSGSTPAVGADSTAAAAGPTRSSEDAARRARAVSRGKATGIKFDLDPEQAKEALEAKYRG